ncbi:hypothetical protein ACFPK1_27875 [Actinomycetospora rhizophila]|uniref:Uncharacterized protein n=1 Tax=Actinomycetospora rhizophila TaxID=1416876 RepID=A0ABV9ZRJ9_9PSEU
MLREPSTSPLAPPAAAPDTLPAALDGAPPPPPADLRALVRRARSDPGAARELAAALLARGWSTRPVAALAGLAESAVTALARVRRPGTAAGSVADDVAARARRRSAGAEEPPPAPRRRPSA